MNAFNLTQKLPLFILIALISFCLNACTKDKHNHQNLSTGEEYYNEHCTACHNKEGSGTFLKGIPANIATNKNKTEIILHIKRGSQDKHSQMPIFPNMPDDEAKKIANYLLHLKNKYFNNPDNKGKVLLKR